MGVGAVKVENLDDFVAECDRLGGISHPDCADYISNFSLVIDTIVDQTLDPFSEQYFEQQIVLYKAISGRVLNQEEGEMTEINQANRSSPNPYGSPDVNFIARHARTIHASIIASDLKAGARVLDLGCGWGLSTEMIGFTGAYVHAVDINPDFIELVKARCEQRNINFSASVSNFDDFHTDEKFDLAFFYECFHHSVKPWITLENISKFMAPGGKITFAGEPINNIWWKNWGLRLDALSVYCIKKFGWFESGWSAEFLIQCFERAGWSLSLTPGIGLDGADIGVAVRLSTDKNENIDVPYVIKTSWNAADLPSEVGKIVETARNVKKGESGYVTYGPYAALPSGRYKYSISYQSEAIVDPLVPIGIVEVYLPSKNTILESTEFFSTKGELLQIENKFEVPRSDFPEIVEVRIKTHGMEALNVYNLNIEKY